MFDLPLTDPGILILDSVVQTGEPDDGYFNRTLGNAQGVGPAKAQDRRVRWRNAFQDAEDLLDDFKSYYLSVTQEATDESTRNTGEALFIDIQNSDGTALFDYLEFPMSYSTFIEYGIITIGADVEEYVYNSESTVGKLRSLYLLIFNKDELDFQYVPKQPPHDSDAAPRS